MTVPPIWRLLSVQRPEICSAAVGGEVAHQSETVTVALAGELQPGLVPAAVADPVFRLAANPLGLVLVRSFPVPAQCPSKPEKGPVAARAGCKPAPKDKSSASEQPTIAARRSDGLERKKDVMENHLIIPFAYISGAGRGLPPMSGKDRYCPAAGPA